MAVTHTNKRSLYFRSSVPPFILSAESLFSRTYSSYKYSPHFQQNPWDHWKARSVKRPHTVFHFTSTDVSILVNLISLYLLSLLSSLILLLLSLPSFLSSCLTQFLKWTHHILSSIRPFPHIFARSKLINAPCTEYWGILFHKESGHWPALWLHSTLTLLEGRYFLEKSVSLSHFWQTSFLTKPMVGSPELKACQQPFLHMWPWR